MAKRAFEIEIEGDTAALASGHRVKLICDNVDYTGARVWIDGKEVVDLTSVQIGVKVGELNSVKLEFIPAELDIEVSAPAEPADDLPLTIPVESIIVSALRELRDHSGLDRDEAYLLARLEQSDDGTAALRRAIREAPE